MFSSFCIGVGNTPSFFCKIRDRFHQILISTGYLFPAALSVCPGFASGGSMTGLTELIIPHLEILKGILL